MSEYAIELKDVSYSYGKGTPFYRLALDRVDLQIKSGRITGIIGHTGSGKSTLLQMMNGLLRPDKGQVLLFGRDVWEKPKKIREIAFRVGLVFQYPEYQLFEETVYRDVAYGPKNMGLDDSETERRVAEALRFVGMDESCFELSPFELSGGQKRRVAIAGIIAMEPEVLVLDEPAAGLDPRGREEIFGNLREYQRSTGKTVVIVSHSMEDMAVYAEDLVVMRNGRIQAVGECREAFGRKELFADGGLRLPQVTLIAQKLKELGMPVEDGLYTVQEACGALLPLLNGGGAPC